MAAHETSTATEHSLRCVVVTPERAVLDEPATFVAIPMYDGELGVLPGRLPLIGRLGFGELRVVQGSTVKRFYLDGGFVQVRDNVITLLTSRAVPAEDIKTDAAQAILHPAPGPVTADQQRQQERARAQLRVARKGSNAPVAAGH